MKTSLFLFLFIYSCVSYICHAQNSILKLSIKGRDTIETKTIDSITYSKNFQSFSELKNEINAIQKKIIQQGYLDFTLQNIQKTSDSTVITNLSLNTKYKKINILYDNTIIPKSILLKIGTIHITDSLFSIPITKTKKTLQYLTNYLVNQGNTFSNLQLSNITKKGTDVFSKLISSKSSKRTIDKIITKGYTKFPASYIKHYSRLKIGKTFTKSELLKKSQNIENLSFAKNSKPPEILFNKDSTTIYLYIEKQSANTFDGFLGFASNTESGNLKLNGYLNLNLTNNLNFGERLRIIYKNDGNEQQRFKGNIQLPYILRTPIGIEAEIDVFKKDSSFLVTQQKILLNYLITDKNNLSIGYNTSSSNNLLNIPQPLLKIEDYTSSFYSAGFNHTKLQNNPLFRIKKNLSLLTEFGSRKTNTKSTNQIKTSASINHIIELNERNSIYVMNITAAIFSDNIFANELYRFGGINSIRGFEENSLSASLYNVFNSEYRYILASNLYMHSIIDYAYFEDDSNNLSDNLTSFGFGLGLNTQTGIFKIVFANGKNSSQNFKFSNTKIHISLTSQF